MWTCIFIAVNAVARPKLRLGRPDFPHFGFVRCDPGRLSAIGGSCPEHETEHETASAADSWSTRTRRLGSAIPRREAKPGGPTSTGIQPAGFSLNSATNKQFFFDLSSIGVSMY